MLRCKYSIGVEHQLAEVGALYGVSWLELWKLNPQIMHPDYILFSGQAIDLGRLLEVSPNDNLHSLALRYGTSLDAIYDLNMDLGRSSVRGSPPFSRARAPFLFRVAIFWCLHLNHAHGSSTHAWCSVLLNRPLSLKGFAPSLQR